MRLPRPLVLVLLLILGCAATPIRVDTAQKQCCGPPPPPTLTAVTAPVPLVGSPQAQSVTISGTNFTAPLTLFLSNPSGTQVGTALGGTNATSVTFSAVFNAAGQWTLQVKSAKRGWSNVLVITVIVQTPPPLPLTLTCPADISTTTTGTSATVIVPAAIPGGGTPPYTVVAAPASGSAFPLLTTAVAQTVTDTSTPQPMTLTQTPCPSVTVTQIQPPPNPPPGTVVLTADVQLTGTANYQLAGTAGSHVALQCNGFKFFAPDTSWTGIFSLVYVDATGCGSASADALGGTTAGQSAYLSGGTVTLDHTTWHTSGGIDLYTVNNACVSITNSVWSADNVWPAGYNAQSVPGIINERGTSTCSKLFQGNQVFTSWASFGSPNWLVGATSCTVGNAALSNIFIGNRAGFAVLGTGSVASCNYAHSIEQVTPTVPYWADVENFRGPGAGAVVHDNVFNSGQWMTTGIDGTLQNNVYANGGGHDYWRIGNGGTAKNNILFGATGFSNGQRYGSGISYTAIPGEAAAIDLVQAGNHFAVTHNTIDVSGDVEHGCARVVSGATLDAYQSNVCVGVTLGTSASGTTIAAVMPDPSEGTLTPAPNRVTVADHNDTTFIGTPTVVYNITTAGGQPCAAGGAGASDLGTCNGAGVSPQFRGPLPIAGPYDLAGDHSAAFPFNDSDILNGTYTVADLLSWARWVYAPGGGSPLLGAGADGKDLGAVDTSTLPGSAPAIVTTNKRPVAIAGPSFTTGATQFGSDTSHAELVGWGADDGLPSGTLTFLWSQVSGPGSATFDFPTRSAATVTLPVCGVYVFKLTVSDGTLASTDQTTITETCSGGAVHPLIWLTPTRLTALKAKVSGNDADWLAVKANADAFVLMTIPAYDPSACSSNQICYTYEGNGWYDALTTLGLAYQATGNAGYAAQGIALMKVINAAGVTPETVDSGYPSRSAAAGLAIAYDWFYPQLDAGTKAATIATLNAYYDWAKANAFDFVPVCNPLGNYCGGHILGFGLAGIATTSDNSRASEITSFIANIWSTAIGPAFTTGGQLQSGYPYEGYTYGINHFLRLLAYTDAVKTSGGSDIETPIIGPIALSFVYNEKPNRWQFTDEADYAGNCVGIPDPSILFMLATMGPAVTNAAYTQWIYTHLAPNPCGQVAPAGNRFEWYTSTATATNPNALALAWYSPGDEHEFTRSDWTDTAVWTSARMLVAAPATHQLRGAGNIEMQRGTDYLLVNGGQWKGSTGVTGNPQAFDDASWRANTAQIATAWSSDYTGGQGWWGTNHTLTHTETSTYGNICADLQSAYNAGTGGAGTGPAPNLKTFNRCAVTLLENGSMVIGDHLVLTTPTDLHSENWHVNPASVPIISGQTVTTSVGSSKLQIAIVTPGTLSFSVHDDPVSVTDATRATYRIEAADSSGATTLDIITVLSAYAASGAPPTITPLGGLSVQVGARTVTFATGMTGVTVQ